MVTLARKYRVINHIAGGTFGEIYLGVCLRTNEKVAIKVESTKSNAPQLLYEASVYVVLNGALGIPRYYDFVKGHSLNALVLQLLGPSLEDLFNYCKRKFTLKTVLMLADQMIARLKFVHSKGFVHRDIKPQNFVVGCDENCKKIYIIDFGLAKRYYNRKNGGHIPYRENKKLLGTVRYASKNAHRGVELSRRDDMESLGYLLVYFCKGSLPWQGTKAANKRQNYEIIGEIKQSLPLKDLCRSLPNEFHSYFYHCRDLSFEGKPNYLMLRNLFLSLLYRLNHQYDYIYDWTILNEASNRDDTDMRQLRQHRPASKKKAQKPSQQCKDMELFGVRFSS